MKRLVFIVTFFVCFGGIWGQNPYHSVEVAKTFPIYRNWNKSHSWSIESVNLNVEKNQIEVIESYYQESVLMLPMNPPIPAPPRIEARKFIFGVVDGKIKLIKTLNAVYVDSVVTATTKKRVFKK